MSPGATCASQSIIQTLSPAYVCKFHVSVVAKLLCTEQETRRGDAPRGKVCSLVGLKILFCLDQWREVWPQGNKTSAAEPFQIWSTSWSQIKYTTMEYILLHFRQTTPRFSPPVLFRVQSLDTAPHSAARLSSLKMLFYSILSSLGEVCPVRATSDGGSP